MHWLRSLFAALTVAALLPFAAAQAGDRAESIAAALTSGQYAQALEMLRPALQASPGDARLWAMQGAAWTGEGDTKRALASYQSALKIAPDYLPALHGAAQIDFDRSSPEAIPLLERLLQLRPQDEVGHGMLAVLEYQQGNCAEAVNHFESTGALFDSKPGALHAWAACLVRLHKPDQAVPLLERTLGQSPGDEHERRLLASLQIMANESQDALATLAPLLSGAGDPDALELASSAFEDLHETDKAVDTLRRAIILDPDNVQLYVDFAAMASAHQSFQVGMNVVNDGIGLHPNAAALYFARGVLHVQLAQYDMAQSDFETAYRLDPNQSLSTAALGLAAVEQNDLDRALTAVEEKLQRRPGDPILLYLQADVLLEKGAEPGSPEFQRAMRSAQSAVRLGPQLGPAHAVLAKLYLQAGSYPKAVSECHKALEIDPTDQASLYHLIQALKKSGQTSGIPDLLKRLAQLRQDATEKEREEYRYRLVDGSEPVQ
ncbi:MAG TPA: tetratricopeptide repeat protein [Terracidiphilus sp.]|nr:tetratricopeptide repeat protein [Terracidiphilus sp.]